MSVVSIKSAIKNKLQSCSHIQAVYDYETGKETGHPYAVVTKNRLESRFADNKRNINDWFFNIRLYVEKTPEGFGVSSERISDEATDEILNAFHMDTTLSGACKFVEPVDADFTYVEMPEAVRLAEFTLKAEEVFDTSLGTTT